MRMDASNAWSPPADWHRLTTIDAHTGGEPFRVVTSGVPEIPGQTMLERRRYAKENLDHLRTALMWEPRGHADMYGALLTPPVTEGADLGVLFLHNEGFSTMCGHGIIGLATVLLETGMFPAVAPETTLRIDAPAGLVTAFARIEKGHVTSVRFHNVPSFVLALDAEVDVPGIGSVRYDLAYGGAFYAYVDARPLGLEIVPEELPELIEKGRAIKKAVQAKSPPSHPIEADLGFLYGTILTSGSRNVCVFAEGEVDRSPTGTGVSGRLAIDYARGKIGLGEPLSIESIVGSRFGGRVVSATKVGPYDAVIPEVEGSAHVTGRHEFFINPKDPLRSGFLLR